PHWKLFSDFPDFFPGEGVPGDEGTHIAAGPDLVWCVRSDERRPRDAGRRRHREIHAEIVGRYIEETGPTGIRRSRNGTLPTLDGGTDVLGLAFRGAGLLGGFQYGSPVCQINSLGPGDIYERLRDQHLAARTVHSVSESVLVEM